MSACIDGGMEGGYYPTLMCIHLLEQHMVPLIICKYLDMRPGWAVRKTAGMPWRHSSITFSHLKSIHRGFPARTITTWYKWPFWPPDWRDMRGQIQRHALSTQTYWRCAFGKLQLATCVGRTQRQSEGQGPVLSFPRRHSPLPCISAKSDPRHRGAN